jgi:hypothetical protein
MKKTVKQAKNMGNPELTLQWSYSTAPEIPGYGIRMKRRPENGFRTLDI